MNVVVISQPMFLPWIGLFEQIKLSDIYVHYDDVQYPQGRSFTNRVQIKRESGFLWLTVPVIHQGLQLIKDVLIDDSRDWRRKHMKTLRHNYARAPFVEEMFSLLERIYSFKTKYLSELNIHAIEAICKYFNLERRFLISSGFNMSSGSSQKLLDLVQALHGSTYITGHGAKNYLDHELFERNCIRVEYIDYKRTPYRQLHGNFNPHVSILDLIANEGAEGIKYIHSTTKYWKDFIL